MWYEMLEDNGREQIINLNKCSSIERIENVIRFTMIDRFIYEDVYEGEEGAVESFIDLCAKLKFVHL